ncbi:Alpha/beta hydrolase family protein [Maioricimonas rarisocia]|uniref:Alpha/beta hydrolase family protein n=1 Tax=Maioricimonas rarisocia TaxID=2528026 RepID=A0A517ZC74_9PLAN|nr:alpha/beta fold hydrolase [Maioricimonas rarisocia]QDU40055.1 Alpha/beta hydrolase family protein [Maioricimonas rarisocia]
MSSRKREVVIVLHGLGGSRWSNWLLARRIAAAGYEVENWCYPSVRCSIPTVVDEMTDRFARFAESSGADSIHVVAHSMGGIVTRAVLAAKPELPIDRTVMLAPPNHGSPAATWFAPYVGWLSPAIVELSDCEGSYVRCLPPRLRQDVGLILAAYDKVVPVESTSLDAVRDVVTVPSQHGLLPFRRDVAEYCTNFLKHGQFAAADAAESVSSGVFAAVR